MIHETIAAPDERDLARKASAASFERGLDYADAGAVMRLRSSPLGVTALVQGTHAYRVEVVVVAGRIGGSCDCPVGSEGEFCKHCVAVALVWGRADAERAPGVPTPEQAVRAYLTGLDSEELVELVFDLVRRDDDLFEHLRMRAALVSATPNVRQLQRDLDRTLCIEGFVHYSDSPGYYRRAEDALEVLGALISAGHADAAIVLAEHALERLEEAIQTIDDSDGGMRELLNEVEATHVAACEAARPDPAELARRLYKQRAESEWDRFHDVVETYANVLGEPGLAELRRLARDEWEALPALGPGERGRSFESGRFKVQSLLESLAEAEGDVDAFVVVASRNLSSPHAFLRIATTLAESGRPGEALDWAERGWHAGFERQDPRLREFLAQSYARADRTTEALDLLWAAFLDSPGKATFDALAIVAAQAGAAQHWSDRALRHLRESADAATASGASHSRWSVSNRARGALVEVLLASGDAAGAVAAAKPADCPETTLESLGDAVCRSLPDEAIEVYSRVIDRVLRPTGDSAYRKAAYICVRVRATYLASDDRAGWLAFEARLRESQKRRPKFQSILRSVLASAR